MAKNVKYDIYVYVDALKMTLFSMTYEFTAERDLEYVKERFIANNPRYEDAPDTVFVSKRDAEDAAISRATGEG